jgi:hypothetical protein
MPKPKKYWGVEKNPNRHGRLRWYFRRPDKKGAPRIRLPDSYGSLEFEAAWRAAMSGQPLPLSPGQGRGQRKPSRGTLGWLIRLYLTSAEFQAFRPSTRRQRVAMLERLAADKGTADLEAIDATVIRDSLKARSDKPLMANVWLTAVSTVFAWALRETLPDPATGEAKPILDANPCEGVKRLAIPKAADPDAEVGHPTFSDDDLAQFEAAYAEGTRERLVYSVLLYTGLRVGDAARLAPRKPAPTSRSALSRRSPARSPPGRTEARRRSTSSPHRAARRGARIISAGGSASGARRSASTARRMGCARPRRASMPSAGRPCRS